jgi:hypothetical protein
MTYALHAGEIATPGAAKLASTLNELVSPRKKWRFIAGVGLRKRRANSIIQEVFMSSTNWNNGQLITLSPGDTATCQQLNASQLYGLIFYNSAGNDAGANLSVVWSQSQPPATVHVPGTTGNQGLASVLFVNGSDTTTVSAAMLQNQPGAQVQTYIASVKMPTDTSGINNQSLPADGQPHSFNKFTRYYTVPA